MLHDKIGQFSLQLNNHPHAFAQDHCTRKPADVPYVLPISSQSIVTQGSKFNRINNFYCFIKDIVKGH